jgi:hypothetical protein
MATKFMEITAKQTEDGWILINQENGEAVQERFGWPTKEAALEAATKLWPENSVWNGKESDNGGWLIDIS